jgi:anti-sigma factor RsiW
MAVCRSQGDSDLRSMSRFCKSEACPSSDRLLEYQSGALQSDDAAAVSEHLSDCDFCSAEIQLYKLYPHTEETVGAPDIPHALYDLAQALLTPSGEYRELFDSLAEEGEEQKPAAV